MSNFTNPSQSHEFHAFSQFEPSEAAAIIFIVAFTLLLIAHLGQSVRYKIWYMWPLIASTALLVVAYSLREFCIHDRTNQSTFIVSQVFVVVAPACLAAELYWLVCKAMTFIGSKYSLIRPSFITPIFVGIDIASIGTQAGGSITLFNQDGESALQKMRTGRLILVLGLLFQLAGFCVFLFLAIFFDRKAHRAGKGELRVLRPLMNAFYISGALIVLRSIYRAVEFLTMDLSTTDMSGYLLDTEWPYYVLDALPVAAAILVYNFLFPAKYLPEKGDDGDDLALVNL
ncbi:hypothetical protein CPB86DRAFT_786169 [Serendipita vermifera]|nr:hypothetical protein CPB86DRAFT_786169 [Serendipita vermifera]